MNPKKNTHKLILIMLVFATGRDQYYLYLSVGVFFGAPLRVSNSRSPSSVSPKLIVVFAINFGDLIQSNLKFKIKKK